MGEAKGSPGRDRKKGRSRAVAGGAIGLVVLVILLGVGLFAAAGRGDEDPATVRETIRPSTSASPSKAASTGPGHATGTPTVVSTPTGSLPAAPTTGAHPTAKPVGIKETAKPGRGTSASLLPIRSVKGKAKFPGEVTGPVTEVVVDIVNDGPRPLDMSRAATNLYYGTESIPAVLYETGTKAFPRRLAAGTSSKATYVFAVPASQRSQVTVEVDLGVQFRVVLFRGRPPR